LDERNYYRHQIRIITVSLEIFSFVGPEDREVTASETQNLPTSLSLDSRLERHENINFRPVHLTKSVNRNSKNQTKISTNKNPTKEASRGLAPAMRIPMFKRVIIALLNIFFPPLAVALLCGPNEDLIFNCLLFLLAVIPSHIHGFYISLTYFNRKRKVRRGVYPGKPRSGIWSEKVNTGGVGRREVERLKYDKEEKKRLAKAASRGSGGGGGGGGGIMAEQISRRSSNRMVEDWDDGTAGSMKDYESAPSGRRISSRAMPRTSHRARRERPRYYDDVDY